MDKKWVALSPPGKGKDILDWIRPKRVVTSHLNGGHKGHLPQKSHSALGCRQVLGHTEIRQRRRGWWQTDHMPGPC